MNYIGIDIGDGESCVCVLPQDSAIEPQPIPITGRKSFVSAVAVDEDGKTLVGMDAVSAGLANDFSVRFKSRFLKGNERDFRDMRRFLKGIYDELCRQMPLHGDDKVVFGCPAGWDEAAREKYLEMIRDAGYPNPRLVSESRGGFLYAKHARSIQLDPDLLEKSALVIDIGSSTLDFAYVLDGRESGVGTFGDVYLGGGAIDEALLEAAVKASKRERSLRETFEEAPEWKNMAMLAARRVKEEYFTRQSQGKKGAVKETLTILYDEPIALKIQADDNLIFQVIQLKTALLNGNSFFGMLDNALRDAVKKTKDCPPALVLVTGGASRMQFFREQCVKRFPNAQVVFCEEPEFSIAKGLAISARVDEMIFAFNREIRAFLEGNALKEAISRRKPEMIDALTDAMAGICFDQTREALCQWQDGGYNTLDDMSRALPERLQNTLNSPEAEEALTSAVTASMAGICGSIQGEIDKICLKYGVEPSQMSLTGVDISPTRVDGIDISEEFSALVRVVQVAIVGATALVAAVTGAFLSAVDLVVIGVVGVLVLFVGKEKIGSMVTKISFPKWIRKKVDLGKIVTPDLHKKLRDSIRGKIQDNDELWRGITDAAETSISGHVRRLAQRTEITINT